ncbi:MAG TPA: LPS export ABC transporter periplasmic protein LptC [Bacillota bacterium]|nr:LPS export ABC transporter periplasmic protein LptC [Bacillota bacterium]HOL10562.1 LPS export ABC transporter periplasmic protein LptC [Bacillota bacterium]HPO98322.1 LPS export ABC transporter periplasmic protein LptC [Bacillota bacterium]
MQKKQWFMILGSIIIIIVLIMIGFSVLKPGHLEDRTVVVPKNQEEFIGIEVKIPGKEPNQFWELKVAKMTDLNYEQGCLTKIEGKYIIDQVPQYFVKADSGTVLWKQNIITLSGNVVLNTIDGKKITMETLQWDSDNNNLNAQGKVSYDDGSSIINTEKVSADLDLKKLVFAGMTNVKVRGKK